MTNTPNASVSCSVHSSAGRKALRRASQTRRPSDRATSERLRREQMVREHMPLVEKIARSVGYNIRHRIEREELVSWGVTGLLEAIDRYVPGGAASFSTFAYYRIRGAMLDGIGTIAPLSRNSYRQARSQNDCAAIYRPKITPEELADSRESTSPAALAERGQLHEILHDAIDKLPKAQRDLIRAHYWSEESLLDAGKTLGISKSWASRTHARALRELRKQVQAA